MTKPLIGLLDCNNFFVSCERLFRPDLKGKPVVVLSSNDGCVVARSQEIKDIGVPMGVPYFQIKDTLNKHRATTFSSHFALYRDISRRVFAVMRSELDQVEQYSIDEAFFLVTEDPEGTARRVKQAVEKAVGIPVSVGVAPTKTLAKFANREAKRGKGVHVFDTANWAELAPTVALSQIWGVGGQLEKRYASHGMRAVGDLLQADQARIQQLFGVGGVRLQRELSGKMVFALHEKHEPQQSIMSSRSFPGTVTDQAVLADAVAYHVRHAAADLRAQAQVTGHVRVSIYPSRHGDFVLRGGTKEAILTAPTNNTLTLLNVAHTLLEELYEPDVPYKKAGVTFLELGPAEGVTGTLFAPDTTPVNARLMAVVDQLNQHSGREVVLLGSRLKGDRWQARSEVRSPAYTTRWSDIATVKTENS